MTRSGTGAPSRSAPGPAPRYGPGATAPGQGTLHVVATPIGNLADVTLRAIEVLRGVPLVAAEDTRITRRMLDRHGIATRLVSFHARSGAGRLGELLAHLRGGSDLALVTDAGTPVVSDPGEDLVAAWAAEGGRVVPIPGPSAVLAAVVASAVAGPRWAFEGFLPRSGRARRERLARIAADDRATVLFEAPGRLAGTLRDLAAACGADRRAAVCRELTKLHEQTERGTLGALTGAVASGVIPARGEIVIVVGPAPRPDPRTGAGVGHATPEEEQARRDAARAEVRALMDAGVPRVEAAKQVAARTGFARRALYRDEPS